MVLCSTLIQVCKVCLPTKKEYFDFRFSMLQLHSYHKSSTPYLYFPTSHITHHTPPAPSPFQSLVSYHTIQFPALTRDTQGYTALHSTAPHRMQFRTVHAFPPAQLRSSRSIASQSMDIPAARSGSGKSGSMNRRFKTSGCRCALATRF